MARHKMINGICRICGQETKLSFEHVPPRTTFNRLTKYESVPFDNYLNTENPLKKPPRGKPKQGGIGYNSFCKRCNSYLGTEFVPEYKKWVNSGYKSLRNKEFGLGHYTINQIVPEKILKQIVSMFLAINGEWYLDSYPELSNYVKQKNCNKLPECYRIFCYLTRAENVRYLRHTVSNQINCSEIAFPPFGYVLTLKSEKSLPFLTDISSFKDFHHPIDLNISFFQLPTYLPVPLDYRSKEQIEKDIEKNSRIKS